MALFALQQLATLSTVTLALVCVCVLCLLLCASFNGCHWAARAFDKQHIKLIVVCIFAHTYTQTCITMHIMLNHSVLRLSAGVHQQQTITVRTDALSLHSYSLTLSTASLSLSDLSLSHPLSVSLECTWESFGIGNAPSLQRVTRRCCRASCHLHTRLNWFVNTLSIST